MANTTAIDCSKPQPLAEKFDADAITKQLEDGRTAMLEVALGKAQSLSERTDMLKVVQGINATHRLEQPDKHLPSLSVDVEAVGNWARPSLQVSLKRQEYKNFAVPEPIYVEKNSGFGARQTREVVKTKH
ncbi:MAG: hypothetical protein Q8T09_15495 [Candidatus Melainabacteria bacterium]|nr:hypothetical protein [Candidatus Melainabacteria bacterium]